MNLLSAEGFFLLIIKSLMQCVFYCMFAVRYVLARMCACISMHVVPNSSHVGFIAPSGRSWCILWLVQGKEDDANQ